MSYPITQTNGQLIMTLLDGTADGPDVNPGLNRTDINLIGKNYPAYGNLQNENFIKLLQNFANNLPPSNPLLGELWYDSGAGFIKVYSGTEWHTVSPLTVGTTAPTASAAGEQWWDTVNKQLKIWDGLSWIVIGPAFSAVDGVSGAVVENILDTINNSHTVVKFYVNDVVVSILSNDATFTPQTPISGFTTLSPGVTLSTANGQVLTGTATNAQNLGGISSGNFARVDITPTFLANLNIGGGDFALRTSSGTGVVSLTNTRIDAGLEIYNNVGGVSTKTLSIDGTTGLISVVGSPVNSTHIATKGYVDSLVSTTASQYAPLNSAGLTGTPTSTTPFASDSSTRIATTAFTQAAIANSNSALWQGAARHVSANTPGALDGEIGDFWFQI